MMLAFSACGTFLIHSGFKSAREKDIQNGYNNASVVCINLVQNVKRTINLVYRDTGYEKQKNVVVRQAAQSVSVRNAGEEVQFALWTDEKTRIYSTNGLKGADVSICRDDLEAGQEGYKIVKRNGRYMLYTGTSFQVLDRVYYVETFSDITRDYENRDAQLRMFRMIMIIVMIVCLMLMAILNNMIVVPIRRLSKATKLVAGGRAGIRIRKRSKDEIGVLAEDFNRMSTSLNRTMKELEEKTKSQCCREITSRYDLPIVISENGLGAFDKFEDGKIHDPYRIDYLKRHIEELKKACDDGCRVLAYCTWSYTDLLSWLNGYQKRYGFVYVDREEDENSGTLNRYKKDSFDWYKHVIETNGEEL